MTGLHNGHAHVRGNGEIQPEGPMPADTFTLGHLMQRAGYRTGIIGKWGLGHPGSESTPDKMGFDDFFGYNCQRKAHEYYPEYLWRNNERVVLNGEKYSHDLMADEELEFVRRHREQPFFLFLAFTIPHQKLQVPDLGPYADEPWPENLRKLASMITRMDRDVGRLMALLKELNLDEKTLVFFTSDNGAAYNDNLFNHSGPLRGRKRDMYEGGLRSPSIARWPGRIPPGTVERSGLGVLGRAADSGGLTRQEVQQDIDGGSILPALLERKPVEHPPLYFEIHERGFHQAARIGDWKAVRLGTAAPLELYDLTTDLGERNDVADRHPEVVQQFERFLASARTESELWPIRENPRRGARRR